MCVCVCVCRSHPPAPSRDAPAPRSAGAPLDPPSTLTRLSLTSASPILQASPVVAPALGRVLGHPGVGPFGGHRWPPSPFLAMGHTCPRVSTAGSPRAARLCCPWLVPVTLVTMTGADPAGGAGPLPCSGHAAPFPASSLCRCPRVAPRCSAPPRRGLHSTAQLPPVPAHLPLPPAAPSDPPGERGALVTQAEPPQQQLGSRHPPTAPSKVAAVKWKRMLRCPLQV